MVIVYLHQNIINSKCYVGQTEKTVSQRWQYGRGYKTANNFIWRYK